MNLSRIALFAMTLALVGTSLRLNHATTTPAAPLGTATLAVRFLYQGQPLILALAGRGIFANGQQCLIAFPAVAEEGIRWALSWPAVSEPLDCAAIGATVRICFTADLCAETVWRGEDTVLDLEVPRPAGKSVVTARFVRDGRPAPVTVTAWDYQAGGRTCLDAFARGGGLAAASVSRFWPLHSSNPDCDRVDSPITASFVTTELGVVQNTFVWSGQDVVFDVVVGPAPPGQLPSTGLGPSSTDHRHPFLLAAVVISTILLLTSSSLTLLKRRSSKRR